MATPTTSLTSTSPASSSASAAASSTVPLSRTHLVGIIGSFLGALVLCIAMRIDRRRRNKNIDVKQQLLAAAYFQLELKTTL
ncbi:hypothetical protein DFH07DRAFT_955869 [Mycena maculata]|uniref:Transmembrane protein n=1 Tax=Mycena maculata TaxID=230809 RepID=A0AAD7JHM7_9AGAR|nr:hypothetical protein DFH07DRAFT_955869 [Mycena maculata]